MHIAEGYLPPWHAATWTAVAAPFVVHGARAVVRGARLLNRAPGSGREPEESAQPRDPPIEPRGQAFTVSSLGIVQPRAQVGVVHGHGGGGQRDRRDPTVGTVRQDAAQELPEHPLVPVRRGELPVPQRLDPLQQSVSCERTVGVVQVVPEHELHALTHSRLGGEVRAVEQLLQPLQKQRLFLLLLAYQSLVSQSKPLIQSFLKFLNVL